MIARNRLALSGGFDGTGEPGGEVMSGTFATWASLKGEYGFIRSGEWDVIIERRALRAVGRSDVAYGSILIFEVVPTTVSTMKRVTRLISVEDPTPFSICDLHEQEIWRRLRPKSSK
jgi:hypothetical protein